MKQISDEDAYEQLHEAGFSVLEIYRIIKQRQNYAASHLDQASPVRTRPRFAHWRIRKRKLTGQIARQNVSYASLRGKMSILKTVFASLIFNKLKEAPKSVI